MNRWLASGACVGGVVLLVAGTLSRPDQTAVAGAVDFFAAQSRNPCAPGAVPIEGLGSATTDEAGAFMADLFSSSAGEACLIVTVVARSDTAKFWRLADFGVGGDHPDTVGLALTFGED
jgi:hypothetical protein